MQSVRLAHKIWKKAEAFWDLELIEKRVNNRRTVALLRGLGGFFGRGGFWKVFFFSFFHMYVHL